MFQQMKYFLAVVDEHSFTKAAQKCHISQSAISQQIKELNQLVGSPLLQRKGRSFELTPAGKYFYRQAQLILQQVNEALAHTRHIANAEQEEYVLKLGYLQMFGTTEFLKAVTAFSAQYPQVKVKITSGQHDQLFQLLLTDQIDLDFSDQRRALSAEYHNQFLTKAPLMISVAQNRFNNHDKKITTDQLSTLACIMVAADEDEKSYYRDVLGIKSDFVIAKTVDEAKLLIASQQGYLVANERTIRETHPEGTQSFYLFNGHTQLFQNYYAYWKRDNSGYYIETFADILKRQFES